VKDIRVAVYLAVKARSKMTAKVMIGMEGTNAVHPHGSPAPSVPEVKMLKMMRLRRRKVDFMEKRDLRSDIFLPQEETTAKSSDMHD